MDKAVPSMMLPVCRACRKRYGCPPSVSARREVSHVSYSSKNERKNSLGR